MLSRTEDIESQLAPLRAQLRRGTPHEADFGYFASMEGVEGLFVDAGANAGQSAVSLRSVNRSLEILSFEPNPMLEPILHRLREGLLTGFDYRMTGLSDRRESRTLYVPVIDDLLVTPLATLDPTLFERRHYHEQLNALSLTGSYEVEKVTVVLEPLDELGLEPAVVKLDTEEHELSCLDGMVATIERCRPIFMIERNPQEEQIGSVLANLGYERFVYAPDADELVPWHPRVDSVNVFYVHRDHDLDG